MNAKYGTVAALTLALLAATTACSKPPEEYKELRSRFQLMVERIGSEPPCSYEIPMHWSPSLPVPVPVLIDQRLHYQVFFSGWQGRPDTGIVIHDAEGDALFSADGKILECRQRSQTGRIIPREKFSVLTGLGHAAAYRALSPKFWTWVEQNGGTGPKVAIATKK